LQRFARFASNPVAEGPRARACAKIFFTANRALRAPPDRALTALRVRAPVAFGCVRAVATNIRKPAWNRYFFHFSKKSRAIVLIASTRRASVRGIDRQATMGGVAGAGYTLR
jgi:hypothetical protein